MKKKKGFTLIELLAVIAVMAIFVLLVTPNIMTAYKNAKIKTALTNGESIVKIAKQYYEVSMINGNEISKSTFKYSNGEEINTEGNKLLTKGGKPESGVIYISKTGEVAMAIYFNGVCLRKSFEYYTITPTTENLEECNMNLEPTITLNGDAQMCIKLNNTYTDLGAKAYSNEEVDISERIIKTTTRNGETVGDVDVSIEGKYIITYAINDGDATASVAKEVNVVNPIANFDYIGSEQIFTVVCSATYKLEVWGAQGGTATQYAKGGLGGYSIGKIVLNKDTQLYVNVGGQGFFYGYIPGGGIGGFNGGGRTTNQNASSGGGGTDIRIEGNTIYHRLIVAGGGGGAFANGNYNYQKDGGYGGGLTGGPGITTSYPGQGGTQTAGGAKGGAKASTPGTFWLGGTGGYNVGTNAQAAGAGGGGWYGGGGGDGQYGCGGGGSGYVWTSSTASSAPAEYLVPITYYLTDAQIYAGNTSFLKPSGGNETGHTGNGYVRITME